MRASFHPAPVSRILMHDFRLSRRHDDNHPPRPEEEEPRTIRAWARDRLGDDAEGLTLSAVLAAFPRRPGLRWDRVADSPLGGRIAPHLRHLADDEARDLEARGQAFLDDTDVDGDDARETGVAADELARLESAIDR